MPVLPPVRRTVTAMLAVVSETLADVARKPANPALPLPAGFTRASARLELKSSPTAMILPSACAIKPRPSTWADLAGPAEIDDGYAIVAKGGIQQARIRINAGDKHIGWQIGIGKRNRKTSHADTAIIEKDDRLCVCNMVHPETRYSRAAECRVQPAVWQQTNQSRIRLLLGLPRNPASINEPSGIAVQAVARAKLPGTIYLRDPLLPNDESAEPFAFTRIASMSLTESLPHQ